ncbi:MAG: hypothetical protein R2695_14135 [Acidimicrobiales bacterium]
MDDTSDQGASPDEVVPPSPPPDPPRVALGADGAVVLPPAPPGAERSWWQRILRGGC